MEVIDDVFYPEFSASAVRGASYLASSASCSAGDDTSSGVWRSIYEISSELYQSGI